MTKKRPYHLAPDSVSHDTVECLSQLLALAEAGTIVGIAYVAMYKRREFIADAVGEAYRNPTFARGMLRALDDDLGRRVRGED